jgi:type 2 lantibiotic biosynthesis protein LanM
VILADPEAEWTAALTLRERRSDGRTPGVFDPARARRRLDRWRALPGFEAGELFERRLAADDLSVETLLALLGESSRDLAARVAAEPPWLRQIRAAYSAPPAAEPLPWPIRSPDDRTELLALVEPLARAGLDRVRAEVGDLAHLFLAALADRLRVLWVRVLVVELQAARMEGVLDGDTPAERYRSFVGRLRDPAVALGVLRRYPVLARDAARRVRQWETASLELVRRLAADHDVIVDRFAGGRDPGELVEVTAGLGDAHRDGRSVAILRFASGLRLVYKPRSLSIDRAFQRLLSWVGERGFEPRYRTLAVLDRGDYGWVEHVAPAPCASRAEVERFYRRQGGYLALLYLLEGTDFHMENLVAAGEHPVLVDLETLFHPQVYVDDPHRPAAAGGRGFHDSVLRIGLLPQRIWGDDEHGGVDLGGLGSADDQLTRPFWTPVDGGTDAMRFEKRPQRVDAGTNRPRLAGGDGAPIGAQCFAEAVEAGFRELYRLLIEHRRVLSAPGGPLAAFAGVEARVVLRPTATYGTLLMESGHPHAAGEALERARLFDRLWSGARSRPWLAAVVPHEIAALERGDVPRFTAHPDSRDLGTDTGERIPDVFPEPGLERARRCLDALSERDLDRQAWLIRASLGILTLESGEGGRLATTIEEAQAPPADELVRAAGAIGEHLENLAFREGDDVRWLSSQALGPGHWALLDAPADLYLGSPGIALFLAHLGKLTGDGGATALAAAALATVRRGLDGTPPEALAIGAFNGWGGLIHAFTHLGLLWDEPELLAEAEALAARVREGLAADEHHDLLAGAAGALLALLGLDDARPSDAARDAAVACGEHLLARAVPMARGVGWVMKAAGPRPLAGLSHGAAGISLALLHLARRTGDERFHRAALDGLDYERSLYDPERRNWPDLRDGAAELSQVHGEGEEHFMCGWCHGAAGIGLARVASLPLLDDGAEREAALEEIHTAVETTLAEGLQGNHSLCHGALGNLDFLLQAARALDDRRLEERVRRLASGVLRSIERDGWLHGLPRGAEPLGLMVGLAGIGHGLLRLAAPDAVPSLLTLELPTIEETAYGRVARAVPGGVRWGRRLPTE